MMSLWGHLHLTTPHPCSCAALGATLSSPLTPNEWKWWCMLQGACSDHQEAPRACQTPHRTVYLPLQPLAKPPLYTVDRKRRTESPAAVKPAGAPFHTPGPHMGPLSFLPRGEGAACPMGHAPYSGDLQTVPRGFCLWHTSQLHDRASCCSMQLHGQPTALSQLFSFTGSE